MKKVFLIITLIITGFNVFSQQTYSWEEQAREIVTQADEILTDTTSQVAAFKESLQSLVRESFQVADSYKITADSLKAELTKINTSYLQMSETQKQNENLKLYVLAGGGGLILILLVLTLIMAGKAAGNGKKYKKVFAENKEIHSALAKMKEEAEQLNLKADRMSAELKDSLEDNRALNEKNKTLILSESALQTEKTAWVAQNSELQKIIAEKDAEISEAKNELAVLKSELSEMQSRLQQIVAESASKNSELEKVLNGYRAELEEMKKRAEEITGESLGMKALLNEAQEKAMQYQQMAEQAAGECSTLRETMNVLQKEVSEKYENEIAVLRNEKAILSEENERIKMQLQQSGQLQNINELLQQEKQQLASEMTSLYNQSLILENENKSLKNEIDALRSNIEREVQARMRIDKELEKFVEELKGFLPLP